MILKKKSILSHFLFRYGSLSDPNTAPCATAASPSSTTTAPGWATAWVRRPRSHFTRLDDRSRGMSGRLICIKRHRPLKTSAPFPIVTSNCSVCKQKQKNRKSLFFFFFFSVDRKREPPLLHGLPLLPAVHDLLDDLRLHLL